ncbi:glutathione S-transferase family protein [Sinorhizobium medicae]|uniref:Glutathione S-transferase n=2 Tax=Sinorhizobium medicae TaxID=110321 RepID=A0A508X733_9HYPH|nr:glutathione S-transferase [Sinorhizobium medicae]ABR62931.1 Glutathione S-transferase domain [Sinorhizobium medicae WSM419]MDX0435656.1 glutathione S-transferase [Sinorhizobium medicae]MDX0452020.1 glutathione S-transferase [Sinorhizobium medicae]MDX0520153.1 glutathione S-transferase [Sinorhizobium medicae]MDX0547267.1 glutathione S-transferase [Sinorhizobium medicae]
MKLYHHPLSGHAHRVRLFLSLLGLEHELVHVDLASKEHKQEPFLKLNPFGQLPVLDDGGTIVPDSNAILVYLAKKAGCTDWLPEDAGGAAAVQRWLSVAAGQIAHGPAQARLITLFQAPYRPEEVIPRSHAILKLIESELGGRSWIAAERPTIADVALYSYVARAPEGDVDLHPYPEIRSWLARIEALPGFVEFQKTPAGLAA